MQRTPGYMTTEGMRWYAKLERAQRVVDQAVARRDDMAREALASGLGVRGVALALGVDKGTVSRRYRRSDS
jgi:hypothetical protein